MRILLFFLLISAMQMSGQRLLMDIPRDSISMDSLTRYIYAMEHLNPKKDKYGIEYSRRWGLLKPSTKIDASRFYEECKRYCIERLGEEYFYSYFRLSRNSILDNPNSEIFSITFYYFPFDSAKQYLIYDSSNYVPIVFKSFNFLNINEVEMPVNLPDCTRSPKNCLFHFDKKTTQKWLEENGFPSEEGYSFRFKMLDNLVWQVTSTKDGWAFYKFWIDSRSGNILKRWEEHRID